MRKIKKASPASGKSSKDAASPLKARSLSELRELQRQSGTEPAPQPAKQIRRRPHRFLPPSAKAITPVPAEPDRPARGHSQRANTTLSGSQHVHVRSPAAPSRTNHGADSADTAPTGTDHSAVSTGTAATRTDSAVSAEHQLSAEDIALFRRVVESVTPGPKSNRLVLAPVPPGTPAQLKQRRHQAMGQAAPPALDVSDQYASGQLEHDDTVYLGSGQGPHLIKGLKKGKWPVQASLDLHGSTLDDARERMDRFIQSCRDHDIRCVRIVHGKGYGSKDGNPVLKETVRRWLSQLAVVQAYIEADEANGGGGAVLALLNKIRR